MTVFSTPDRVVIRRTRGRDELEHVEVDGDDRRLEVVARIELLGDRPDDVVGLVARHLVDRDPQRLDDLADLRELVAQVVRHPRPGRLVLGVLLVAERRAGQVERDREVVGLEVLEAAQDDAGEAERAVDEVALRRRQGRKREVAAVDEPVAVEQHQAFGGHEWSVPAGPVRTRSGRAGQAARRPRRRARSGGRSRRTSATAEHDREQRPRGPTARCSRRVSISRAPAPRRRLGRRRRRRAGAMPTLAGVATGRRPGASAAGCDRSDDGADGRRRRPVLAGAAAAADGGGGRTAAAAAASPEPRRTSAGARGGVRGCWRRSLAAAACGAGAQPAELPRLSCDVADQEAGEPERREADAERPGQASRGAERRADEPAPAGRPEARGLAGVSRKSRGRRRRSAAAAAAVARAIATRSSWRVAQSAQESGQGDGLVAVGAGEVAGGERGHEHRVVAVVGRRADVGDVGHGASDDLQSVRFHGARSARGDQPRNSSIRSASRSRRASRPRWIRDFTVPSETPGHVGDLGVVVALDVEQDDRGPLVVGDRRQGGVERPMALGREGGRHRIGVLAGRRLPALVLELRVGLDGRRLRARWMSIAALTAIRLSHDLTLPPRKPAGCG